MQIVHGKNSVYSADVEIIAINEFYKVSIIAYFVSGDQITELVLL
jgi:hypothetical protein